MSEWLTFDRWGDCSRMERPGFVCEVMNREGLSLFTPCAASLPTPWDWKSGPVRFRLVEAPKPRHSAPVPKPQHP